jgi:hypothetical protein
MFKFLVAVVAITTCTVASLHAAQLTVDLRDARALEQLEKSNPVHFAKIREIVAGLFEQPVRVEKGWLQTNFDARDVELSRLLILTSHPPKQLLQFTLDDVRYTIHVTRSDMSAKAVPAK